MGARAVDLVMNLHPVNLVERIGGRVLLRASTPPRSAP
jgi:hypothetical protein